MWHEHHIKPQQFSSFVWKTEADIMPINPPKLNSPPNREVHFWNTQLQSWNRYVEVTLSLIENPEELWLKTSRLRNFLQIKLTNYVAQSKYSG